MSEFPDDLVPLPTMPYDQRPDYLALDVEECRTALWKCQGNITKAAEVLKVPAARLRTFVSKSPRLSAEVDEAREVMLDVAEHNIFDALTDSEDKQRRDNMSRFVAQNLGARRGYGPRGQGIQLNMNSKSGEFKISWGDGTEIRPDNGKMIDAEPVSE